MNGVLISSDGDVKGRDSTQFAVDSEHPLWMCNLRAEPKHYGLIRCRIASLSAFTTRSVLSVTHGYQTTPSFITQWYYPAGTSTSADRQTYGIGTLEILTPASDLITFDCDMSDTRFTINVTNETSNAVTNLYAEFKYFIFAQPLSLLADQ